jgi:putative hydrolase
MSTNEGAGDGAHENFDPKDFEAFLRSFLDGNSSFDTEKLAEAAGLPKDPAALSALINQLQSAISSMPESGAGVNWQLALKQAREIAHQGSQSVSENARRQILDAVSIGSLWLNQATSISELSTEPKLLTREVWVADAIALFEALASPIASRMSDALSANLSQNLPEELEAVAGPAAKMFKSAGGALFAMQLGQALGKMSREVLAGGDIGLPIFQDQRAAFVPQNLVEFVGGLEVEPDQVYIYLAVREMAHARLFKHSKWLREHVVSQIAAYSSEISLDTSKVEEIAADFDPANPEDIKRIIESGGLIAERTPDQNRALERIEIMLALIEGWVDAVTADATKLLPKASAIGEAVRRRRATGGPAEQTFQTLIGLELRPRKLREAAAMWSALGEKLGTEKRDSLWNHPDLVPSASEIENPNALIERLGLSEGHDSIDDELRKLLGE